MDIKLHFQEKGSGEAFIFLHGNGNDSCYFKNQIEYFSRNYHVLALDTRGHGMSPRGSAPFTIQQFSWDLYDFMKTHQISKAVILGFSDGANIAMEFAIKHPHMVKALILNGGNLNTKEIANNIPGAKLVIIKGDHFIANKRPAEFNYEVDAFLALLSVGFASSNEMV